MSRLLSGRRAVPLLTVMIALLLLTATMVAANHDFTDVPNSSDFHGSISWLADRGITGGCGGGKFCPKNAVTREQMSLFLQRTAGVIGPAVQAVPTGVFVGIADVDLDATPVVCQTANHAAPYEQRAILDGRASLEPDIIPLEFYVRTVYQNVTDSPGTWTSTLPDVSAVSGAQNAGRDVSNDHVGYANLAAGKTYKFGIRLHPWDSTSSGDATLEADGDLADPGAWCSMLAQVFNRNP